MSTTHSDIMAIYLRFVTSNLCMWCARTPVKGARPGRRIGGRYAAHGAQEKPDRLFASAFGRADNLSGLLV